MIFYSYVVEIDISGRSLLRHWPHRVYYLGHCRARSGYTFQCDFPLLSWSLAVSMTLCLGCLSVLVALALSVYVLQKLCFPYFWRDLLFLQKVVRYGVKLEVFKLTSSVRTVLDRFLQQVQRIPDKPFVIYDGNVHTYRDIDRRSNRLANVFLEKANLRKGDCVALLMNNEPDFLCVWFGLAKVGCSVAFLNTNIKSKSLLHCFNSCGAKTLIVGSGKSLISLKWL